MSIADDAGRIKCGAKLEVVQYPEEDCIYFYKLACKNCENNGEKSFKVIQVANSLKPDSSCPNCLVGILRQTPVKERGVGLVCDSCNRFILFGYSLSGLKIDPLGLST